MINSCWRILEPLMNTSRLWILITALSVTLSGCAQTSLFQSTNRLVQSVTGRKDQQQATRLLCLWEAAEGQGLDGGNARGFAGQILFFGYRDAAPLKIDGDVRIYQYDNYDPDEINPKPIHVFQFEQNAWNAHHAETTFGHSYNVFLPYVKRHRDRAHCALKVEFTPKNGRTIVSPITEITLDARRSRPRTQSAVQRNVLQQQAGADTTPVRRRSSATQSTPDPGGPVTAKRIDGKQLDSLTIQLPAAEWPAAAE